MPYNISERWKKMIFKRKIHDKLLKWKSESQGKTALLIEGARRIGKSTAVVEFAKVNYKSYILIDFANEDEQIKNLFFNNLNDLDSFFMYLSLHKKTKLYERNTLIIFDEVQKFPKAREAIKYLVKDGRYDYIETGSLISIKENVKGILLPSEERKISMHPMDFEEFTWAIGNDQIVPFIKNAFDEMKPIDKHIHELLMETFRLYLVLGGMPKVISTFLKESKQFKSCLDDKTDILETYRGDIFKIERTYREKVLNVFDQIPSFLAQYEKRIKFTQQGSAARSKNYEDAFAWLKDSKICNICPAVTDPNIGLALSESNSYLKCYMGDTGLLLAKTFSDKESEKTQIYLDLLNDKLSINKGMFFENIVSQILTANGHKLYFYSHYSKEKKRNDIEVDFIITSNEPFGKITAIEVKSAKNYQTTSLNKFKEKFKSRVDKCYIIHPKNFHVREDGVICIPAYMAICI